jgi:Flp pilus assembly protein TadG
LGLQKQLRSPDWEGVPRGPLRARRGVRADDRGAALVEFALVFPLLIAFVMAIFTIGAAYNTRMTMTAAARDGARYAAVLDKTQTFASGTSWGSAVTQRVVDRAAGSGVTTADVCVYLLQGPTSGTTPGPATIQPGASFRNLSAASGVCPTAMPTLDVNEQAVQVTIRRQAQIQVLFFSRDVTLVATNTITYEAG